MFSCNKIKLIILMTFCDRSVIVCLELLSFSMWIATSRLHSGFLCYCKPKYGEFSEQVITLSAWFHNSGIWKRHVFASLDTAVSREFGWCLTTGVYKKLMHTEQFVAYHTHHPQSVTSISMGFNVSHRTAKNLAVRNKKLQKRLTVKISLDMVTERN